MATSWTWIYSESTNIPPCHCYLEGALAKPWRRYNTDIPTLSPLLVVTFLTERRHPSGALRRSIPGKLISALILHCSEAEAEADDEYNCGALASMSGHRR